MSQSTEKTFHSAERYNVELMRYLKFASGMTNEQIAAKIKEMAPTVAVSEPTVSRFLNGQNNNIDFLKAYVLATGGDWAFVARLNLSDSEILSAVRVRGGSSASVAKARRTASTSAGQKSRRAVA
jgi:hypothetical protein